MKFKFFLLSIVGTVFLLLLSYLKILPMSMIEVLGFSTGAVCVWLATREDVMSWPIGIANGIFFVILFFQARLYGDMGINILYIVLGILGWYWWLKGGKNKSELKVASTPVITKATLVVVGIIGTYGMMKYLGSIGDVSPFLDGLTTVLSLIAQYMLTRKYIENWYVWIMADVFYIYLYFIKNLYLTGILYVLFIIMCIIGLKRWRQSRKTALNRVAIVK
jgi:nicotinamide mononucleotide transporter